MPRDRFGREIDYLRLSVTDHCNLRCVYCMPLRGLSFIPSPELLTAAEIETVVRAAVGVGFHKFRLTGGEPTLRPDIVEITRRIGGVPGVEDLAMTSNAILMPRLAVPLKEAGLTRLNIHVDTLDPERLTKLMRFGSIEEVEAGIAAAEEAGLLPIKINCTVTRDYNDTDVVDLARRALESDWHVRFIELMPLGGGETAHVALSQFVPSSETRRRIEAELGPLVPVENSSLCDEARNFRFEAGARSGRLHLAGERALLRVLQPHAPDRRRQVPPLPAERRRAGREEGAAQRRWRRRRWRRSSCERSPSSRPGTGSTKVSPPGAAPCSRSGASRRQVRGAGRGRSDEPEAGARSQSRRGPGPAAGHAPRRGGAGRGRRAVLRERRLRPAPSRGPLPRTSRGDPGGSSSSPTRRTGSRGRGSRPAREGRPWRGEATGQRHDGLTFPEEVLFTPLAARPGRPRGAGPEREPAGRGAT